MIAIIGVLWVAGIIGATIYSSQGKVKETSLELIDTVITNNNYPQIGNILSWANEQQIDIDYKGMLE